MLFLFLESLKQRCCVLYPVADHKCQGTFAMFCQDGGGKLLVVFRKLDEFLCRMDAPLYLRENFVLFFQSPQRGCRTMNGKINAVQPARIKSCAAPKGTAGHGA